MPGEEDRKKKDGTVLDEVFREISETDERDTARKPREDGHEGEAADAITPNTGAQQESEGD
ncbi:hypothetical protein ACF1A5_08120 [Streptomyces sp. NPDC014864]|uniref:hypothetical protein n=1 Tax=Streptomyces sp. NPDC014864 TaxID=3364924 RepID=UPI0037008278